MKSEVPILPIRGLQEAEFVRVYKLPVVVVPTNVPSVRVDLPMEVYPNARGKWTAVAVEVRAMRELGRPVLVGTTSVTSSEVLSDILTAYNISHNLLNARPQVSDVKLHPPPLRGLHSHALLPVCRQRVRTLAPLAKRKEEAEQSPGAFAVAPMINSGTFRPIVLFPHPACWSWKCSLGILHVPVCACPASHITYRATPYP
jgi:hypothetical protein